MKKIATVTIKATGERYTVYSVPGSTGDYPVWVAATGYACHCPCKARAFNKHKRCKHMLACQQWLDSQRATAPLYRESFAVMK